ncbi:LysR family transcriptional regulator [Egbenema bharatensis]|uniref:LysR family transcriptional regulator n=1 Tax=Egbenema bharatensis TaxID=3463334 RepID=UPI003A87DF4D
MKSIDITAIDLNLLVAFEAVFEEQSVTAAAQRLHLGQPAMSAALGRLRLLFQDELFIRMGRDMKPTAKALEIAPGILMALQQIRLTLQASQEFEPATAQQTFVIGISDYGSTVIVPRLLNLCRQTAPGIDLRLISYEKDQVDELLKQPSTTVIVGSNFPDLTRLTFQQPLMEERFVGICRKGHPALSQGAMLLEQFAELPHALVTLRRDEVGVIDRALAARNLQRRIVLTTPYFLTLPAIVSSSDTIAAIPLRLARKFAEQGWVEWFELPLEIAPWMISMVWSQLSDQALACRWLRQTIQQICQEI